MTVTADSMALDQAKTAGDLIAAGNQLLQIRTQHQLTVAIQRPRDEAVFAAKLAAEAAEAGEDFFYSIPYKDHAPGCADRRRCNCPSKPVEGPGVGLARSAARLWRNCSVDTTLERDMDDAWLVGAWFIDFEANYTKHEVKRVSKMKPTRGGGSVRVSDHELDSAYQRGASKVERDVILRALPKHAIERAFELAKLAALTEKAPVPDQVARLVRRFSEVGVTLAQVERYLGHPFNAAEMTKAGKDPREVCAHLRGVITAIKGGDVDAAEVFQDPGTAPAAEPAVTLEDLAPVRPASGAVEASDHDARALFALLMEKSASGRVFVKEKPAGSGKFRLVDAEAVKDLGLKPDALVAEAGELVDLVLAGRLTAWLAAR